MSKIDLIRKITSRKFLGTLFVQIASLVTAIRTGDDPTKSIASLVILCIVTVVYVHTEGKVDASRAAVELIETEFDPTDDGEDDPEE